MKVFQYLGLILIILSGYLYSQTIVITSPTPGEVLCKGSAFNIRWTSSGITGPLKIVLYGPAPSSTQMVIASNTPDDGLYAWSAPASIPDGTYWIQIKTVDNVGFSERVEFQIITCLFPIRRFKVFARFNYFWWLPKREGGIIICPRCGVLDIKSFSDAANRIKHEPTNVAIYSSGKLVVKLGRFGRENLLKPKIDVRFSRRDYKAIKQGGHGFELRFLNMKGQLLYSQPIQIKIKQELKPIQHNHKTIKQEESK